MTKNHDYMACQGNICQSDPEKELRNWWPGEKICSGSPYKKFQKVQGRINRMLAKGKLKNPDTYYFLEDLEKIGRVTPSTEGIPSERKFKTVSVAKKEAYNRHKLKHEYPGMTTTSFL